MYGESQINKVYDKLWLLNEQRKRDREYQDEKIRLYLDRLSRANDPNQRPSSNDSPTEKEN